MAATLQGRSFDGAIVIYVPHLQDGNPTKFILFMWISAKNSGLQQRPRAGLLAQVGGLMEIYGCCATTLNPKPSQLHSTET